LNSLGLVVLGWATENLTVGTGFDFILLAVNET
jgi:hypothetical protein